MRDFSLSEDYASLDHSQRDLKSVRVMISSDLKILRDKREVCLNSLDQYDKDQTVSGLSISGQFSDSQRERLERLMTMTDQVCQSLDLLTGDCQSYETLLTCPIIEDLVRTWSDKLRVNLTHTVSEVSILQSEVSQVISEILTEMTEDPETAVSD